MIALTASVIVHQDEEVVGHIFPGDTVHVAGSIGAGYDFVDDDFRITTMRVQVTNEGDELVEFGFDAEGVQS